MTIFPPKVDRIDGRRFMQPQTRYRPPHLYTKTRAYGPENTDWFEDRLSLPESHVVHHSKTGPLMIANGMVRPCSSPWLEKLARGAKVKEHVMSRKLTSARSSAAQQVCYPSLGRASWLPWRLGRDHSPSLP
jgi:hypothetical protein